MSKQRTKISKSCDTCEYYEWYYDWCNKWHCEIDFRQVCIFHPDYSEPTD